MRLHTHLRTLDNCTDFVSMGANLRVNISDGTACLVGQLVDESSIGHSGRVVHGRADRNAFWGREDRRMRMNKTHNFTIDNTLIPLQI